MRGVPCGDQYVCPPYHRLATPAARVALRAAPRTTVGAPRRVDAMCEPRAIDEWHRNVSLERRRPTSYGPGHAHGAWVSRGVPRAARVSRRACRVPRGQRAGSTCDRKARQSTRARRQPEICWPAGATGGWMTPAATRAESGYPAAHLGAGHAPLVFDRTRYRYETTLVGQQPPRRQPADFRPPRARSAVRRAPWRVPSRRSSRPSARRRGTSGTRSCRSARGRTG